MRKDLQGSRMAQSASQRVLSPSMNQADAISVADMIELAKADRYVSIPPNNWAYGTIFDTESALTA